jgi:hypothetical protein
MDGRLSLRIKQQITKCDETIRESKTVIESSKDWLEAFHKNQAQSRISQIDRRSLADRPDTKP